MSKRVEKMQQLQSRVAELDTYKLRFAQTGQARWKHAIAEARESISRLNRELQGKATHQ